MIQYQVAITPLVDFWADSEPSPALRREALTHLQDALSAVAGDAARWPEADGSGRPAETLDVAALYALRAAAAWLEDHDDLDAFEPGDAPWDHPVFEAFDSGARASRFPQLLETDADVAAFVPAKLPNVLYLSEYDGDARHATEAADGEGDGEEIAVGSLSALLRELDTFAVMLQVPAGLDPYDTNTPAFDAAVDRNAPAVWALTLLRRRAHEALKAGIPLVLFAVEDIEPGEATDRGDV